MNVRTWAYSFVLAFPMTALSQGVRPRVPAVRCARLLDVRTGAVLRNAVIAIDNGGRVQSVVADAPLPDGGLELSKGTCMPGLIDAHTHLL